MEVSSVTEGKKGKLPIFLRKKKGKRGVHQMRMENCGGEKRKGKKGGGGGVRAWSGGGKGVGGGRTFRVCPLILFRNFLLLLKEKKEKDRKIR